MSVQKVASGQEHTRAIDSNETMAEGSQLHHQTPGKSPDTHEGSLGSHLMFGLGMLVFLIPMLIPGLSMVWLSIVYGSLIFALVAGFALWSIAGSFRSRRSRS